jgi:hypothetical protein
MMFPNSSVPLQEAPSRIPLQRAVIKFDGREQITLIESTINGPAGTYGWVVPLPKKPSYVKAVKPDYIAGTFQHVNPPVRQLASEDTFSLLLCGLLATALFLTAGLRYRRFDSHVRILMFIGELFLVALLYNGAPKLLGGPSGAGAAAATAGADKSTEMYRKLQVESYGTVGAYEVSVLEGASADPVMEWLERHHIQVPANSRSVIDQYAKEGWVFMAAEIRKDENRALPPHPLKVVFDTDHVIYPMRLTGTQDGPLHLELVVVGQSKARVEGMQEWTCSNDSLLVSVARDPRNDSDLYNEWRDGLYAMAKNGAVVTYLRGDFEPAAMAKDFTVKWEPYERYAAEVYDVKQAAEHAKAMFLKWLPTLAGLFGFLAILWSGRAREIAIGGCVLALLCSGIVSWSWLHSIKTVETEPQNLYGRAF